MSNLTRLEKNNQDLETLKTDIENLPDYQNIEPIYGRSGGINLITKNDLGLSSYGNILNISQSGPYIVVGCSKSSHLLKIENNSYSYLKTITTSSYGQYCYLLGFNSEYVFVMIMNDDYYSAKTSIYAINLNTKQIITIQDNLMKLYSHGFYALNENFIDISYYSSGDKRMVSIYV